MIIVKSILKSIDTLIKIVKEKIRFQCFCFHFSKITLIVEIIMNLKLQLLLAEASLNLHVHIDQLKEDVISFRWNMRRYINESICGEIKVMKFWRNNPCCSYHSFIFKKILARYSTEKHLGFKNSYQQFG